MLETYRRGTAILKELTQNADDAGATRLDIIVGISPDSGHIHPLLANSAILAANNGPFSESNQSAIKKIGISDKPANDQSIGKYGLGLKSVFHLSDALFFTGATINEVESRSEFLSPWTPMPGDADPAIYPEWDLAESEGSDYVGEQTKSWLSKLDYALDEGYFGLWLPLRKSQPTSEHITNEFPGDTDGFGEVVSWILDEHGYKDLAASMPILRNLESINIWDAKADLFTTPSMTLQINPEGNRRNWDPANPTAKRSWQLKGEMTGFASSDQTYTFTGVETLYDDPHIRAIQALPAWPARRTGTMTPVPEKADPHSAAYFVHSTSDAPPRFRVLQSVFLPVEEIQSDSWNLPYSIDLVLHGYYLVNPSRTSIDFSKRGADDDVASVAASWNNHLRNEHVLPSIIRTLERLHLDHPELVEPPEFETVVRRVEYFLRSKEFLVSATKRDQFVFEISTGGDASGWRRIRSSTKVQSISESDVVNPVQIIPNLVDVPSDVSLVSSSKPRIISQPIQPWDEVFLSHVSDIPSDSFKDENGIEYLVAFVFEKRADYARFENARRVFIRAIQRYVSTATIDELQSKSEGFRRILGALEWPLIVGLQLEEGKSLVHALIQDIAASESDLLCVPTSWVPLSATNSNQLTVSEEDVQTLTTTLNRIGERAQTDSEYQELGDATETIFSNFDTNSLKHLSNHRSATIFAVFDCFASRFILASTDQLERSWDERTLFRNIGYNRRQAEQLQAALDGSRVLLADAGTLEISLGEIAQLVPLCNFASILDSLSTKPHLKTATERAPLLDFLLSDYAGRTQPTESFLAVRYLIHANQEVYDDDSQLLVWDDDTESVWQKVAKSLTSNPDDSWKVIDKFFGDRLNPAQLGLLKIERLNQRAVELMLNEASDMPSIDFGSLDSAERRTLIRNLGPESPHIVRRMSIHETAEGEFVSIDDLCYLSAVTEPFPISDPISKSVIVLRLSDDRLMNNILRDLVEDRLWTASEAIAFSLNTDRPVDHAGSIVLGLKLASSVASIRDKLSETQWMYDKNQVPLAPDQILFLEDDPELTREITSLSEDYASWSQLDDLFLEEKAFRSLREHVLATPQEVVEVFGLILDSNPEYAIGVVPSPISEVQLMDWLGVFDSIPAETMRARSLLDRLMQRVDEPLWREVQIYLLPALRTALDSSRSLQVISFLSDRIQNPRGLSSETKKAHRDYLLEAALTPDFRDVILPNLKLPNANGVWRPTDEISAFAENLDPSDSLSRPYQDLLEGYLPLEVDLVRQNPKRPSAAANYTRTIEDFFDLWAEATSQELAGALAALLGQSEAISAKAERLFESSGYGIDTIRRQFGWRPDPRPNSIGWLAEPDGATVIASTEFQLNLVSGTTGDPVNVMSVAGTHFEAKLGEIKEHLIVGRFAPPLVSLRISEPRTIVVTLSGISPESLGARADSVLRETISYIWQQAYRQAEVSDDLWTVVGKQDQLHLTTVQALISETLLDRINQYRGVDNEILDDMKEAWTSLRYRQKEISKDAPDLGSQLQNIEEEKQKLVAGVDSLLRQSLAVQGALLSSIRKTVDVAQYKPHSILFELFQNADDAVWELKQLGEQPQESSFVVLSSETNVIIAHWGRPLTQQRGPLNHISRYKTDLEKMLVMYASDKSSGDGSSEVTGKFGLGFKSVFLASDQPTVLSKRIGFTVTGGVYPVSLEPEQRIKLRSHIDGAGYSTNGVTIIDLPLTYVAVDEVLERFQALRGLQHVFARNIRTSDLNGEVSSWDPNYFDEVQGVEIGSIGVSGKPLDLLVIRARDGAAIAFALKNKIFTQLPNDIPSIWVTTPTQEQPSVKFAINGDFSIDQGRARIDETSPLNNVVTETLSEQSLKSLLDLAASIESNNLVLGIGGSKGSADSYEFWDSFWSLIGPDLAMNRLGARDHELARQIFWGGSLPAIPSLIRKKQVLPTRLQADHTVLVKTGDIKYVVIGLLDNPIVFSAAAKLSAFNDLIAPGTAVSNREVAAPLEALGFPVQGFERIDLRQFVFSLFRDSKASPVAANEIGTAINKSLTDQLESVDSQTTSEVEHLWSDLCEVLRFKAMDGSWRQASELLVGIKHSDTNPDEPMRAALAPDERKLSNEYDAMGIDFFVSVRPQMHAPTELLTQWVIDADENQRTDALKYLVDGELGRQVLREIRQSSEQSWLNSEDYKNSLPAIEGVFTEDIQSIFVALGARTAGDQWTEDELPEPSPLDPESVLMAVRDWWDSDGASLLKKHDEQLYPETGRLELNTSLPAIRGDIDERKKWIELFTLGATHTFGRVRTAQNSGFIRLMRDRNWLDRVADPESNNGIWGQIFEEFFNSPSDRQQYFYWLSLLANIYQFTTWLEDYVEIFLSLELRGPVSLGSLLEPRSDPHMQGGGIDAPSLQRALGYGVSYVVRELLRFGAISSRDAVPHAYVPQRATVEFLQRIHMPNISNEPAWDRSRLIHRFLEEHLGDEADFGGSYDIPLKLVAQDPELWQRFLAIDKPIDSED